ncbi:hypothetical protein K438DRAFT_1987393 [Mycena galopus ATCC 62051]|nr:hypothetical protein K438DRAFT_1987393 [Mycena galopus ATCC 62051]
MGCLRTNERQTPRHCHLSRSPGIPRSLAYLAWCEESLHLKPRTTISPLPVVVTDPDGSELVRVRKGTILSVVSAPLTKIHDGYRITKTHPAGLHGIPVTFIEDPAGQNARVFLTAIATYLRNHGSIYIPQLFDRFDLFKRITITLPIIPEASPLKIKNVVRASPPVPAIPGTRTPAEPRLQDFALVRTGEVRVLFKMPSYFPAPFNTAGPLAYVEWFTPFSRPELNSNFYVLRRSTRRQRPYGEIINVDRIARNCFLVPQSERGPTDTRWTMENAKELCSAFYLNPHLDTHTFSDM